MFEDLLDDEPGVEASPVEEGLRPPRSSSLCLGHEGPEKELLSLISAGAVPHGMIFAGAEGIGKSTFAFRLARYLLKNRPADPGQDSLFGDAPVAADTLEVTEDDPVFRKVASGGHTDLFTAERQFDEKKGRYKGILDVEQARKVTPFLRMTSSDGGWRVVVIDDADTMNRNAQNALLKILEEPPPNVVLILIAHRAGALIPTIRSRCRVISFDPLSDEHVLSLMQKEAPDEPAKELETLAAISEGSAGRALRYLQEGGLETVHGLIGFLAGWPNWDWPKIHVIADALSRPGQEETYQCFRDVFEWSVSQLLYAKARHSEVLTQKPLQNAGLEGLLAHYSLEGWIKICENLKDHFDQIERSNLDKRQGVLGAFGVFE